MKGRGFTLIELVVTVAIVALLASVALPLAEVSWQRSKERDLRQALRELRGGIDAYKRAFDEGRIARDIGKTGYPPTLQALVEGVADAQNPKAAKIYFLRRIPADPLGGQDWGLRSYESPADDPKPGKDVYDVFTQSDGVGLNGVKYRDW
ncbi:MAG TPA: type II secretion system protein [Burkholderiales bacterium]|nr:type II secretion system protein [Burkholderiales bacterium]